jgi:DNA-binding HxlR family transcriptional regulator
LLVVRDLLLGKERFEEFLASQEGIATNILSERLKRLRDGGLVEQRTSPTHRGRCTYHLTERGKKLDRVILAMIEWGIENLPQTKVHPLAEARVGRWRTRRQ